MKTPFVRGRVAHVCLCAIAASLIGLVAPQLSAATPADDLVACIYTNTAGATLPYRLLIPGSARPGQRYPLVLLLHGAGERGDNNLAQLTHGVRLFTEPSHRGRHPCFLVVPQCPTNERWVEMAWDADRGTRPAQPSGPMQLALGAMDEVIGKHSVDTHRLYVTGLSMGGYGTWDCLTRYPGRFAAALPICGGGDEGTVTVAAGCTPTWAFHSQDDSVVPVHRTRRMIEAMRQAGGRPHYFEYFGLGHNAWDAAYREPELLPWLFAQHLGQRDTYRLRTSPPERPAVAQFPADEDLPGVGPIRKMDWFQKLWCERRLAWWVHREQDTGAVVFLGDSITQGWNTLARDFPEIKTANRGISGDVTRGVLFRLKVDVLDLHPAGIVLLIGTNDLEEGAEPTTIASNIRTILGACNKRYPKMPVILCQVMPSDSSMKRPADQIRRLNRLLDQCASEYPQCTRCDTWSIYADASGNATKAEFPYLLHPNSAGYAKMVQALRPVLSQAGLLRP